MGTSTRGWDGVKSTRGTHDSHEAAVVLRGWPKNVPFGDRADSVARSPALSTGQGKHLFRPILEVPVVPTHAVGAHDGEPFSRPV